MARLQEQLQKERDLRTALEAGLNMSQGPLPISATIDEKVGLSPHLTSILAPDSAPKFNL